jgi:hypothetical protein
MAESKENAKASSSPVDHHEHKGLACPVTKQTNGYCPAQKGDSRSPCPALNTMANHGYIPRDGRKISAQQVTNGLKACYGLSSPLAYFLAYVGFMAISKFGRRVDLFELGQHGRVEHNASLAHHDTPEGDKYAPIEVDPKLVAALIRSDVKPTEKESEASGDDFLLNYEDIARSRVRREEECRPVDSVHQEIARGEMAIILGVWEKTASGKEGAKKGIPVAWWRTWISEGRLPEGWTPDHVQTMRDVVARSKAIRAAADKIRADASANKKEL